MATEKATVFNEAQMYLLRLFSRVKDEKELSDIKKLISNYFYKKLDKQLDKDAQKSKGKTATKTKKPTVKKTVAKKPTGKTRSRASKKQ